MERKNVVVSAKTVEEAIELARRQLDAGPEEVEVEVISRGKPGVLGLFGSQLAQVRVTLLSEGASTARIAKEVIDRLVALMGVRAVSTISKAPADSPDSFLIDLEGEDAGLLIGRRGESLRALQLLLNLMVTQQAGPVHPRVILDVAHYREERAQALRDLALRKAEQVAATGRPWVLEPMPAHERRVIHMALAEHPRVTTASDGFGEGRKVVIVPRRSPPPARETHQ